jgi:hypothetical protein
MAGQETAALLTAQPEILIPQQGVLEPAIIESRPVAEKQPGTPQPQQRTCGVVIQNLTVSLPDVRDSESFVSALQQLVAEFDGHCPEGA